jgi:hypothetical protein
VDSETEDRVRTGVETIDFTRANGSAIVKQYTQECQRAVY